MNEVINRELFCRCGRCEPAVQRILRLEASLCQGAKTALTKRRKEIQRISRAPYFRERYRRKVGAE